MATKEQIAKAATDDAIACLHYGMAKIDHCLTQLNDEQLWWRPSDQMNAIGNLLLHLAGNLGQWIVAGIGDQPDTRDRPGEFAERRTIPKAEVHQRLSSAVEQSCRTLANLEPDDLMTVRRIQGSEVTKMRAMWDSVTHFQGHVQEVISLTRQQLGERYKTHWAPSTKEEGAV